MNARGHITDKNSNVSVRVPYVEFNTGSQLSKKMRTLRPWANSTPIASTYSKKPTIANATNQARATEGKV
jgi:hypothetical protein